MWTQEFYKNTQPDLHFLYQFHPFTVKSIQLEKNEVNTKIVSVREFLSLRLHITMFPPWGRLQTPALITTRKENHKKPEKDDIGQVPPPSLPKLPKRWTIFEVARRGPSTQRGGDSGSVLVLVQDFTVHVEYLRVCGQVCRIHGRIRAIPRNALLARTAFECVQKRV